MYSYNIFQKGEKIRALSKEDCMGFIPQLILADSGKHLHPGRSIKPQINEPYVACGSDTFSVS